MAELKDLTTTDAINKQLEAFGNSLELQADYLQDLKHQLKKVDASADYLDTANNVQVILYEAAKKISEIVENHA